MGVSPAVIAGAAFDRRLSSASQAPIAVAVSGGGDSLALLLLAADWAGKTGRPLLALSVDHRLQAASAAWTRRCGDAAVSLGAGFQALAWDGTKPDTGVPAAARAARHRLLADAARAAGARVILMGHTADDLMESAAMRAEGSTTPDPREWSPSPAWPQGRGVFLLRPLLSARRSDLRDLLRSRGLAWIEDPANANLAYARPRARSRLASEQAGERAVPAASGTDPASQPPPGLAFTADPLSGSIDLPRSVPAAMLAAACLCAAGTDRPPRGRRLAALAARLALPADFTATLAGARIEAAGGRVRICRDAGEQARGGLAPLALQPGAASVWDGRYEIQVRDAGLQARALRGLTARLPADHRNVLATLPAAARGGLPAIVNDLGLVSCPLLAKEHLARGGDVRVRALSGERFAAAIGLVQRESEAYSET